MTPMIGRMSSRSRTWSTGVDSSRIAPAARGCALALLHEADGHRDGDAVGAGS
jgi:hypothetical protein